MRYDSVSRRPGPELDRGLDGGLGRVEVAVPVAAEEGVAGAVDDGHDGGPARVELLSPQYQRGGTRKVERGQAAQDLGGLRRGIRAGMSGHTVVSHVVIAGSTSVAAMVAELLPWLRRRHPSARPRSRPGRGWSDNDLRMIRQRAPDASGALSRSQDQSAEGVGFEPTMGVNP